MLDSLGRLIDWMWTLSPLQSDALWLIWLMVMGIAAFTSVMKMTKGKR